MIKATNAQILK